MNKLHARVPLWLTFFLSFFSAVVYSGTPVWTFTPLTATSATITSTSSATVQYKVTNQSASPHTLALQPITGIMQQTGGAGICANPFALPSKGSSCILSLQITGSLLSHSILGGQVVCQQGTALECYQPTLMELPIPL
jgi:hypothetical protein